MLCPPEACAKLGDLAAQHHAQLLPIEQPAASPDQQPHATAPAPQPPGASITPPSDAAAAAQQGALIIYTSGTTGKPKGVLHTHRQAGRAMLAALV